METSVVELSSVHKLGQAPLETGNMDIMPLQLQGTPANDYIQDDLSTVLALNVDDTWMEPEDDDLDSVPLSIVYKHLYLPKGNNSLKKEEKGEEEISKSNAQTKELPVNHTEEEKMNGKESKESVLQGKGANGKAARKNGAKEKGAKEEAAQEKGDAEKGAPATEKGTTEKGAKETQENEAKEVKLAEGDQSIEREETVNEDINGSPHNPQANGHTMTEKDENDGEESSDSYENGSGDSDAFDASDDNSESGGDDQEEDIEAPSCPVCKEVSGYHHDRRRWFCKPCKKPFTPGASRKKAKGRSR